MAGKSGIARLLERVRSKFVQELDINKVLPRLLRRGIFSVLEEKEILAPAVPQKRIEVLLDILSRKDRNVFVEFCRSLEDCAPHLLTFIVLEAQQGQEEGNPPTQALQLGLEIALKERDAVLRENAKAQEERDEAVRQLEQVKNERDQALFGLESLTGKQGKKHLPGSSASPTRAGSRKMKDKPVTLEAADQAYEELRFSSSAHILNNQTGSNTMWETHNVRLHKAPTFGFGIAVSGGRDSPHFASGDPSVAISDVLKAGPAEGKLQINDRIVSVNGISLENVDHNTAINILRDCGNIVNLVVRRRVILPPSQLERPSPPFKITLSKKNKKDEFGLVLGYKLFIKEIGQHSLAANESALKEGDVVLKINNTPVENLTLLEAKKLLDKSKDKLQLIIKKERCFMGPAPFSDDIVPSKDEINLYRPALHPEDVYVKDLTSGVQHVVPPGAYPNSENTKYDGHYVIDNDLPVQPVLPQSFENNIPQSRDDLKPFPLSQKDLGYGYYADKEDGWQGQGDYPSLRRPEDDTYPSRMIHDLDPRRVAFPKDKQTGLGLRLAGGNATGIFIASVQPGSAGEREGLVEGDQIILANEREITSLTREEAVSYLTSLEGQVTLVVQYRKEEYDRIMASHEAGDSFYVRSHFNYNALDQSEHSIKIGDIFHVKDTLFRGIGGSWLAIKISEDMLEQKKGTIPNSKTAEIIKGQQKEDGDKENFPNRGRGSLFKRKSNTRRAKSLGKDHWDEVIFDETNEEASLSSKFQAYERVVYRDPGFVRPVVIFGAISDIARERLLAEYQDRFDSPQVEKSNDQGDKKEKSAIIRLGSIRDSIARRKHCLLDVTPLNVDRLNYAQYNPIVIYLKADSKQAVKDVRSRWKSAAKNPRKLLEQSEKIEKEYSHLFTGFVSHMGTDAWFPKLCEMIDSQQRQKIWMSEKQPTEDMSDDFMFPMSTRLSYAAGADSDIDAPQPRDDLDMSPMRKQRLVRSSSDPSVNTHENIPGIPPYPSPPTYKNQRIPSQDSRYSVSDTSLRSPVRDDFQMHPEDRYYPSYYSDHISQSYQASRAHIDPYATLTPSERLQSNADTGHYPGGFDGFDPYRHRAEMGGPEGGFGQQKDYVAQNNVQGPEAHGPGGEHRGYTDNSSHSSDSYSKYVSSPQNKHDDTKLREKFANLQPGGRDKGLAHDPYRFTRSTAHPVTGNVDKAKISDLSARYRKQDGPMKSGSGKQTSPPANQQSVAKKDQPPPIPVKSYSMKQRGIESDELKIRNYENSNRAYNYADINAASDRYGPADPTLPLPPPPSASSYPSGLDVDKPYEYMSGRQIQNYGGGSRTSQQPQLYNNRSVYSGGGYNNSTAPTSSSTLPKPSSSHQHQHHQLKMQQQFHQGGRVHSLDSHLPSHPKLYPQLPEKGLMDSKAYANEVYMDHRDLQRARQVNVQPGGYPFPAEQGLRERGREELPGGISTLDRGYARPRTDDEQLQEIHRSRHRAKSETRLAEISGTHPHWKNTSSSVSLPSGDNSGGVRNARSYAGPSSSGGSVLMGRGRSNTQRYKSWDTARHEHDMFVHYTKLITTPGFGSQNKQFSRSSGELRVDVNFPASYSHIPANSGANTRSAFSSYKKPTKQMSFSGLSSAMQEGRSPPRQRPLPSRSQSMGSALRRPLIISPKRVTAPKPPGKLSPVSDPSRQPPHFPAREAIQSPHAVPPREDISKPFDEKRSRPPTLTFPPPPDSPPPVLSFLPLPPPPEFESEKIEANSNVELATQPLPPPTPPLPPVPPIKTVILASVTKTEPGRESNINSAKGDLPKSGGDSHGVATSSSATASRPRKKEETAESIDEKHTIVATAKGIFTSKGGLLESPETGVSILVPAGAIEENKEQEIYFKVCKDNSLLPPLDTEKGETLLSPLVMCGPHGTKFLKPVELRLPHSASANPESWSFALKSSESPSGQTTEWENMTLSGSEGVAKGRVDQTTVSILVDHF